MTEPDGMNQFLDIIRESFTSDQLLKITLGKTRIKNADLKNIFARPIIIRQQKLLSLVFRYQTKDITQNIAIDEALETIKQYLDKDFLQANLFDNSRDVQLLISKKGKINIKSGAPSTPLLQTFSHDKIKRRLINPMGKIYMQQLGITDSEFRIIPKMNDKFRQIDKFIEIIESNLPENKPEKPFQVVDMGSGKGYLTFALYDHLKNTRHFEVNMAGIEMRAELVYKSNKIAAASGFENLKFFKGTIGDYPLEKTDMLIALHACDTATDEAIFKGITAEADFIIVAPCCHKQVRKSMNPENELAPVLKHGIFMERQAELITDGLRGLILEKYGYKIKTLEFISTEHTPKNVMIIATKTNKTVDKVEIINQIEAIKKSFGIEYHHLELLLAAY